MVRETVTPDPDGGNVSIDQRMVELFRGSEGGVFSGEELGAALNVSRTAVWKHVNKLKARGYRIESIPARGYRFLAAPDTLTDIELATGLRTGRFGRRIVSVREADSTNLLAFRLAEEGAEEGSVVIAESQSGGKGRLGRRWESPSGVNLYCSVILRPVMSPARAPQLTFLSAVAVARAIEAVTPLHPQIKWPNDILVNDLKVAGLLNEMSSETDTIHFVVLGIGVNINMRKEQFPEGLRHPASSLLIESGSSVNRVDFTRAFLAALDILYDVYLGRGFAPIRDEWISRSMVRGRRVRVSSGEEKMEGTVSGIDDDGALLLYRSDGVAERVLAGDVTILK